jgi:ubiquinone/menaquinone biosynthesis C-methylase UbiE
MNLEKLTEQEQHSKQYAENYFKEEEEMEGLFKIDIKILSSFITKKGRLLDVSMGPGRHVKYFSDKGFAVWGNDFNKHMINVAKRHVKKAHFTNHDMRNLSSLKNDYFDYAICMGASIDHAKERQKAVNELARVVKKNGFVFIHAHNLFEITEVEDLINLAKLLKNTLLHPKKFELGDVVYHHGETFEQAYMHWFTPKEMKKLMEKAGLKVVRTFFMQGRNQEKLVKNKIRLLTYLNSGGFVFVGKK